MKTPETRCLALIAAAYLGWTSPAPISGAGQDPPGGASTAATAAPMDHVVVVELFTSQGCSSCPPADRLLTLLGQQSSGRVVPLAFHVDFWNHVGWVDPFSKSDWTRRQASYAQRLRLEQLYTPQAVVDGAVELVGSDEARLRAAIAEAAKRPAAKIGLHLEPIASQVSLGVDVDLPQALRTRDLELMLAVFETDLVTAVGRGENGGRTLRNDFVVRSLRRGARLKRDGPAQTHHAEKLGLEKDWNRPRLGVAAFLQDPKSLQIYGADAQLLPAGEQH